MRSNEGEENHFCNNDSGVQEIDIANVIALAVGMFDNVGKAFAFKPLESIFRVEDFENEFLRFRVPFEFGFFS